ncbi:MAG: DUF1016 N-terminal domain-containing protein [Prochlorotrichaceae cyanobacterium]
MHKYLSQGITGSGILLIFRSETSLKLLPDFEIVSSLLTQLSWTHHSVLISRCKNEAERLFYLKLAVRERYSYSPEKIERVL